MPLPETDPSSAASPATRSRSTSKTRSRSKSRARSSKSKARAAARAESRARIRAAAAANSMARSRFSRSRSSHSRSGSTARSQLSSNSNLMTARSQSSLSALATSVASSIRSAVSRSSRSGSSRSKRGKRSTRHQGPRLTGVWFGDKTDASKSLLKMRKLDKKEVKDLAREEPAPRTPTREKLTKLFGRCPYPANKTFKMGPPPSKVEDIRDELMRGGNCFIGNTLVDAVKDLPKDKNAELPLFENDYVRTGTWGYDGHQGIFDGVHRRLNETKINLTVIKINVREAIHHDDPDVVRKKAAQISLQMYLLAYCHHSNIQNASGFLVSCPVTSDKPTIDIFFARLYPLKKIIEKQSKGKWQAKKYSQIMDNKAIRYVVFSVARAIAFLEQFGVRNNAISVENTAVDYEGKIKIFNFSHVSADADRDNSFFSHPIKMVAAAGEDLYDLGFMAFHVAFGTNVFKEGFKELDVYHFVDIKSNLMQVLKTRAPKLEDRVYKALLGYCNLNLYNFMRVSTTTKKDYKLTATQMLKEGPYIDKVDTQTFTDMQLAFFAVLKKTNVNLVPPRESNIDEIGRECYSNQKFDEISTVVDRPGAPPVYQLNGAREPVWKNEPKLTGKVAIKYEDGREPIVYEAKDLPFKEHYIFKFLVRVIDHVGDYGTVYLYGADLITVRAGIHRVLSHMKEKEKRGETANRTATYMALVKNPSKRERKVLIQIAKTDKFAAPEPTPLALSVEKQMQLYEERLMRRKEIDARIAKGKYSHDLSYTGGANMLRPLEAPTTLYPNGTLEFE